MSDIFLYYQDDNEFAEKHMFLERFVDNENKSALQQCKEYLENEVNGVCSGMLYSLENYKVVEGKLLTVTASSIEPKEITIT